MVLYGEGQEGSGEGWESSFEREQSQWAARELLANFSGIANLRERLVRATPCTIIASSEVHFPQLLGPTKMGVAPPGILAEGRRRLLPQGAWPEKAKRTTVLYLRRPFGRCRIPLWPPSARGAAMLC